MTIEIKAPQFPESISEGTIAAWHKQPGDTARRDELLAEVETEKVVLEITAPQDGELLEILKQEGDTVESEEVIARFEEGAAGEAKAEAAPAAESKPASEAEPARTRQPAGPSAAESAPASPAARKLAEEHDLDISHITGSGKSGRITKEDISRAVEETQQRREGAPKEDGGERAAPARSPDGQAEAPPTEPARKPTEPEERPERRVPMTRMRATIARRLVEAQQNTAMLTTFNEVNMKPVMDLRRRYREEFEERHNGTRLGFMSFFVRASVEALKRFPGVNASIDGDDVIYHGYYDIGIAVSTERGLVVPVVRDADALGMAQIEQMIVEFGERARTGKLAIDEMSGGTFTITNGGIFGSLLSTPILNPPQTAILGMHKIEERPKVVDGEIVVRPMMYLALSYDHRLIDGKEAVRFLVTIKELLEDPARILLDL